MNCATKRRTRKAYGHRPGKAEWFFKKWQANPVLAWPENNPLGPANELLSELLRNYTVIPFGD